MAFLVVKLVAVLVILSIVYAILFSGRREKHLAPGGFSQLRHMTTVISSRMFLGPPTLPVIGNAHLIPQKGAHFTYELAN